MGTLTAEQIANMQVTKNQIRCMISNVYDLQKLRISAGNRLVSSFYIQLGIEPSTSPDTAEKDERKLIDVLKTEYKRITDGVATNNYSVKKQIKLMRESKDDQLDYIRSEIDYKLVESYILLLRSEEESVKVLDKYVQAHPLWKEFFEPIKGCGTLMSAVCIAYLDIYKARHVSSFFRYCGLDTVQDVDKDGNALFLAVENNFRKVRMKLCYTYACNGENYFGRIIHTGEFDSEGSEILTSDTGEILECTFAKQGDATVYEDIETGDEYIGEVVVSQHGRRMGDTEMFEYTDKDGNKSMKRGITYNPIIKTKLMGGTYRLFA